MTEDERNARIQETEDAYIEAMRQPKADWIAARDAAQAEYDAAVQQATNENYDEVAGAAQAVYDDAIAKAKLVLRTQDILASETRADAVKAIWEEYNGVTQ